MPFLPPSGCYSRIPSIINTVKAQRLDVTHAYHTKLTESLLPDLEAAVAKLDLKAPTIPLATCTPHEDVPITADYIKPHERASLLSSSGPSS